MEEYIHNLNDGDEAYCLHEGKYYKIKILSVTGTEGDKCFKIHYDGWNSRYDETISFYEAVTRISSTCFKTEPVLTEVKEAESVVKPIDELIDKESLSMELQLAYALYGDNKSSSENEEESSKESSEGVPKLVKYDSITSQSWNDVYFWNLPKYFLFFNDFPFHKKFICNEDRAFLKEIKEMNFDSIIKYFEMDIVKDKEDEILNHLVCPHCSSSFNEKDISPSLKEQVENNLLHVPKILRKVVKKVSKLKKKLGVTKLPTRYPIFLILYDFYNEEIREKVIKNVPICPLYKYVASSVEGLFKKIMILRLLFDIYLPTKLLYRHERIQLTDRYHPNFLTTLLEQRCYIEYSRLYGYEHFIRFFISLRQVASDKKRREPRNKSGSFCSDEEEIENEEEIDEEEGDDNTSEFSINSVGSVIEDPTETPGLFILCQKILNFLVKKKDVYSLKSEEYTFLDPYLVREIDDATVFSGKRNKEPEPPAF